MNYTIHFGKCQWVESIFFKKIDKSFLLCYNVL